jgi:hypothetical protein
MSKWFGGLHGAIFGIALLSAAVLAGEGGSSHVLPGSTATLVDLPPAAPGTFFKPMYFNYDGTASVPTPTAAGIVADLEVTVDTLAIGGGHTFDDTVLGGAHYSVALFVPYVEIDLSGDVQLPGGRVVAKDTKVTGFGDMTVVPIMLAWKTGEWQFDTMLPIYAPTGEYKDGRLGNPSLNYWTFDPNVGVAYSGKESGFNAMLRVGYAINTENNATEYESGSILHIEGAVEQMIPAGAGYVAFGAEAFYFDQLSCDSGNGATLGCFEGETAGLGPVLGYILPLGAQSLALELKWLKELDTTNRLEGDYTWVKAVYKF